MPEATDRMTRLLLVSRVRTAPSLRHRKLNGPVPEGVVLKAAGVPGQLVTLARGVAATLVNTVKVVLLVTLPQAPLTSTL